MRLTCVNEHTRKGRVGCHFQVTFRNNIQKLAEEKPIRVDLENGKIGELIVSCNWWTRVRNFDNITSLTRLVTHYIV